MIGQVAHRLAIVLSVVLGATSLLVSVGPAHADGGNIEVISSSITSEFPEGFRVKVKARGDENITSVQVRVRVGQRSHGSIDALCQGGEFVSFDRWICNALEPAKSVDAELFWRTNTAGSYIPPGVVIVYGFVIKDSGGNILETEEEEFIYHHPGYEWSEISEGPVTISFHGPIESRARLILEAALETFEKMRPVLGNEVDKPVRITVVNNRKEMLEAQQIRSEALARQTQTLGQASTDEGLAVMIADRNSRGTASHEVAHILIFRAGHGTFGRLPSWLDEGLSEYANLDPGFEYDLALEFAVDTNSLLPFMYMDSPPGEAEQLIIFYGQGRSIVRFMLERFGNEKMRELMAEHKRRGNLERALKEVYGHDLVELENMWRVTIGAPPFIPPDESKLALPTAVPRRTLGLFSLTPQADTEVISAKTDVPTATPAPEPAVAPTPEPAATGAKGSGCGAPTEAAAGALDVTSVGILLGVVGLGFRRRRGRGGF